MRTEEKKIYILHGYDSRPNDHWYPWLENRMQKEGFISKSMSFPNPSNPKAEDWLKYLDENIPVLDENSYLVAHSLACPTILRYLQQIRRPSSIGGYVLVAGFYGIIPNSKDSPDSAESYLKTETLLGDFSKFSPDYHYLRSVTKKKVVIAAEDDYILPYKLNMSRDLAGKLEAEFHTIKKGGHFLTEDGFIQFPFIYDLLMEMAEKKNRNK